MDPRDDRRHFSIALSKSAIIFFLGLFVAAQIVFSPAIDNLIRSFLKGYIGLELPRTFEKIPFKSVLIFLLPTLFYLIFRRFARASITWVMERKEKVLVAGLLLSPQLIGLTAGRIEITDLTTLATLILWFSYVLIDKDYKIIWTPLYIPLLLFLVSVFVSLLNGGLQSLFKLPAVMKSAVVFILMVNMIRDREIAFFSLRIFLIGITFSAIIGILQEVIFFFTKIAYVGAISQELKSYMYQTTSLGEMIRVPALTTWYTILANYLSIALIIGLNVILYSSASKKERLFLYMAVPLMAFALYLTFAHSNILILLLAVIISIGIRKPSFSIHITIFLAVILLAFVSGSITDFIADPKKYIITGDLEIRIDLLRDGITGFFNIHPIIGNGIGTAYQYTSNVDRWTAHNNFVMIADELGLFGLFTYGSLFFITIWRQVISIMKTTNRKDRAISLSLFIALIAYLANLQVQSQHVDFFIFLYLGLTEAVISTLAYQVPFGRQYPGSDLKR